MKNTKLAFEKWVVVADKLQGESPSVNIHIKETNEAIFKAVAFSQGNIKRAFLAAEAPELKEALKSLILFIESYVTFDEDLKNEYPSLETDLMKARQLLSRIGE